MPALVNQDRKILRDCTVMQLQYQPVSGVAPAAIAVLGQIETVEIRLKREYADVTAAADLGTSGRAVRWGLGSVSLSGFSASTSSLFSSIFAQGGHAIFLFTEGTGGDSYSLVCRMEEYGKSGGKEANKETLTLQVEGVPYLGPAGTAIAPMVLE